MFSNMTDEKFLRGCVGFFFYPVTSGFLSLGLITAACAVFLQDFGISLASLLCFSISFGIKYFFPVPSLLMEKHSEEEIDNALFDVCQED